MKLSWIVIPCLAIVLAACEEPMAEGRVATEGDARQAAAPERGTVPIAPRPRPATASRMPVASTPALPAAMATPAALDRVTGGNGPRHRLVEHDPPFRTSAAATFNAAWAMTFLPDGRLLVTGKGGALRLFDPATGQTGTVSGVPPWPMAGRAGWATWCCIRSTPATGWSI